MEETPHAPTYEKSILSTMLKHPDTYVARAQADGITEDHFFVPAHKILFLRIGSKPLEELELTSFVTEMHREGLLDDVGGAGYIHEVFSYAPNPMHWSEHVRRLREYRTRRIAVAAAKEISEIAGSSEAEDLTEILAKAAEVSADALQQKNRLWTAERAVTALMEQMRAIAESEDGTPGSPTGLTPIDIVTGGLAPGDLWVIAAETSGGKSVAMIQAATNFLASGKRVLIVSLEMQAPLIVSRMAACHGGVNLRTFRHPKEANKLDLQKAKRTVKEISQWHLTIDDEGGRTVRSIAGLAEMARDIGGGLDLIIVDYIQRVQPETGRRDSREQEVARISSSLKSLAMKLKVPIFTASQLNENGKVRESRAIAQDCDVLLMVGEDGILGSKVRNAQRDQMFPLFLNGATQRFERR